MKIEKISETQVKFILSQADLEARNIKMAELTYGSEKTHRLFQEILRQAHSECDFESENAPLMVEAMPSGSSQVVIVVTKITDGCPLEAVTSHALQRQNRLESLGAPPPPPQEESATHPYIYSFAQLDDAALAADCLRVDFAVSSQLYKHHGRYFLVLQEWEAGAFSDTALLEYGERHVSTAIGVHYLEEHAELLIPEGAVEKLALYLT